MSIAADSPILCYVTSRKALGPDPGATAQLSAIIRRAIDAGVDWIQIREKDLAARELMQLARKAVSSASETRTRILVNDRLDVALAARAGGVHLGGESVPVSAVAAWRNAAQPENKNLVLGASCHSLAQCQSAERDGADYLFFGPVFATTSKAGFGPPQGIERLREVCSAVRIPVLAIGGINAQNAAGCLRAGAAGIAAIRVFQETRSASELTRLVGILRSQK